MQKQISINLFTKYVKYYIYAFARKLPNLRLYHANLTDFGFHAHQRYFLKSFSVPRTFATDCSYEHHFLSSGWGKLISRRKHGFKSLHNLTYVSSQS